KPPGYGGSVVPTNLNVSGASVFSAGDFIRADGSEAILLSAVRRGTYTKLVIAAARLCRALLPGGPGQPRGAVAARRERMRRRSIRADREVVQDQRLFSVHRAVELVTRCLHEDVAVEAEVLLDVLTEVRMVPINARIGEAYRVGEGATGWDGRL